jgi:predicted transcriptional regulator
VYLGLLDADFTVSEPPELVERLRKLADRYHRACTTAAT